MRKKVDSRIRTLVERCVKTGERSLFVVVGDRGREQVVNLHYMLSKSVVKARPSVLWCYKKDLYLSSHRRKRMKQIKKMAQRGLLDPEKEDPFALFVASTNIRYCYYHETHKILGNTFGMCVIQDFEALTPNLLARTVETVEGGGIVVLLLSTMDSLSQLYTMTMDVHARFRTESHKDVVPRFNERFILSLASCKNCLVMDDELNILPHSVHVKDIVPLSEDYGKEDTPEVAELKYLKDSLRETLPAGPLVECCKTLDQAKAVVTFLDAASEKTLRSTVALTAARGRGKSAALGVAIAGALGMGYANIFVTAPSPENLRTLFEFVFKGLDALGYKEHIDYDLVESTNPELGKAIIRVNVFRDHRQTVQYIQPQHHERMSQAELLVIDEAAAIPLPVVRKMLGPYLVFMCSTVNGYEGTGRSLSLKLIQQLREQGLKASRTDGDQAGSSLGVGGRQLREIELNEPIRYAKGDKVEKWLNGLLCLNAAEMLPPVPKRLPHPEECNLYYVNRDTLFSYHKASEAFLQRMMALYVSSHYRNTPNDLQMMSDAPAHHLFVLLGPVDERSNALPDILCVIQVALEGSISKKSALASLSQGAQPQGDLIPWTISQQFQDSDFPCLSGARIVRIATHPGMQRGGYGTRAVTLLSDYYSGLITPLDGADDDEEPNGGTSISTAAGKDLLTEELQPKSDLPPLLMSLAERKCEKLQYMGTSFGLTQELYNFWSKLQFKPVYIRQTPSEVTGENTCIMINALRSEQLEGTEWVSPFVQDFRTRFLSLLGMAFQDFAPALALSIIDPKLTFSEDRLQQIVTGETDLQVWKANGDPFSADDLKRLQQYSNNLVDHHLILDLIPPIARGYFSERLPTNLSYGQAAILLSLGLQSKGLAAVQEALALPSNQILALFNKSVRKLYGVLRTVAEARYGKGLPGNKDTPKLAPLKETLDEVLDDAAEAGNKHLHEQNTKILDAGKLQKFAINVDDEEWEKSLKGKVPGSGLVSLKKTSNTEKGNKSEKHTRGKKSSKNKPSKRQRV